MIVHFEELWEKCEEFQKKASHDDSSSDIINEVTMKLQLLAAIERQTNISQDDMQKAKSRLLGEILLSLTALSLKDNINVFDALFIALEQNSISFYSAKYTE